MKHLKNVQFNTSKNGRIYLADYLSESIKSFFESSSVKKYLGNVSGKLSGELMDLKFDNVTYPGGVTFSSQTNHGARITATVKNTHLGEWQVASGLQVVRDWQEYNNGGYYARYGGNLHSGDDYKIITTSGAAMNTNGDAFAMSTISANREIRLGDAAKVFSMGGGFWTPNSVYFARTEFEPHLGFTNGDATGTHNAGYVNWFKQNVTGGGTFYGFYDAGLSQSRGTSNTYYAFYYTGNAGSATSKWGLYIKGAASRNYIQGRTLIGSEVDDTLNQLQVTGTIGVSSGSNVSQPNIIIGKNLGTAYSTHNTVLGYSNFNIATNVVANYIFGNANFSKVGTSVDCVHVGGFSYEAATSATQNASMGHSVFGRATGITYSVGIGPDAGCGYSGNVNRSVFIGKDAGSDNYGYNANNQEKVIMIGTYLRNTGGAGTNLTVIGHDIDAGTRSNVTIIGNSTQLLNLGYAPEYADNTTAKAAGLVVGDIYRTGEIVKIVF